MRMRIAVAAEICSLRITGFTGAKIKISTFSLYCRFEESIDWINAVAWPMNIAKQTAPETIEIMVNHKSTMVLGGC